MNAPHSLIFLLFAAAGFPAVPEWSGIEPWFKSGIITAAVTVIVSVPVAASVVTVSVSVPVTPAVAVVSA